MADVTAEAAVLAGNSRGMRSVVFTSRDVGYIFCINGDSDLDYIKTTDGGRTWGAPVDVFTGTVIAFDVWYDQWTPGDTGRMIYIFYIESVNGRVQWLSLRTTTDTQVGGGIIFDGASAVAGRGVFVSGCKARGGNLYVAYDIDAGAELGMYRSTDGGASWAVRTNPIEATIDQAQLFPANLADPNDIWLLYHDASADRLTLKTHDDSADTNSESAAFQGVTNILENVTDATGQYLFSGSIRHSDGHLIVACFSEFDTATSCLFMYDVTNESTFVNLTNITTNIDDMYYPSVFLNQDQPDWIYVAYIGKSDGSETLLTTAGVYYALSKDRGLTWTVDIPYSESVTDYRQTWAPLNGERFLVAWMDISSLAIMTNNINSKEFGFTQLENYKGMRATGQNNTGIMSVNGRG